MENSKNSKDGKNPTCSHTGQLFFQPKGEWARVLKDQTDAPYYHSLCEKIAAEYQSQTVYPPADSVLKALDLVDFSAVRVCILGQDPYHGANQANGLAFAVGSGCKIPPSLKNILAELSTDLAVPTPASVTLDGWASQGVLLLNTTLTVREGSPQSHLGMGWERFTDAIISVLSSRQTPIVFILWGAKAATKAPLIAAHHHQIVSPHPSPLSAFRGFFGSKPFSRTNDFLQKVGQPTIDFTKT